MDNLTEDAGEDDIDEDEETNPSSKKEEKQSDIVDIKVWFF